MIRPGKVDPAVKERCCAILGKAYTTHLKGDEQVSGADLEELEASVRALRKETLLYSIVLDKVGNAFFSDPEPSDWETTVPLRPVE